MPGTGYCICGTCIDNANYRNGNGQSLEKGGGGGGGESHFKVIGIFRVPEKLEILVSLARVLLRAVLKEISTCKAHTSLL